MEAYRAGADAVGAGMPLAHLGIFVGNHDSRVADLEFGVTDFAIGLAHAKNFGGTENFLVIIDGLRSILDDQVRRYRIVSFGNEWNFAHGDLLHQCRLRVEVAARTIRRAHHGFLYHNTDPELAQLVWERCLRFS